mmetsp:Transcript_21265/g.59148  ORF Transcript_21265/g.59148 Transcript_21265/m.59148 type:complete len:243 (-) Transcript_21265:382-1110(-)
MRVQGRPSRFTAPCTRISSSRWTIIPLRVVALSLDHLRCHLRNDLLAPALPFVAVGQRVVQIFVARFTKHTTFLQFLCQWNDVIIEEPDLPLVPVVQRILLCATGQVRCVALLEEPFVPLAIHVPVLHGVGDVGSLDQVLDHDGRLAVDTITSCAFRTDRSTFPAAVGSNVANIVVVAVAAVVRSLECLVPALVAEDLEVLVDDVCGHDSVHHKLSETAELGLGGEDGVAQVLEAFIHEEIP